LANAAIAASRVAA